MTTTTEAKAVILKLDVLGRVKVPAERREAILDDFERSGLSGRVYAKQNDTPLRMGVTGVINTMIWVS